MHVDELDVTATEAIRRATNGPELAAAIEAESGLKVRVLGGIEEARYSTLGVISGFYRPVGAVGDMGGGSLEVALALDDHVGDVSVSLPLGALPVEAMLAVGRDEAKREVDERLRAGLPLSLAKPTFYAVGGGWRALAKAHMTAVKAPVRVTHGYALGAAEAREFAKSIWRPAQAKPTQTPGVQSRRARSLPSAALVLDRVLKRLAPERVVFSALGLREGLHLFKALARGAVSRSADRRRAADRAARRARAGIRGGARGLDGRRCFPARRRRRRGYGSPPARSPTWPGATRRNCAPRRRSAACCSFRSSASIIPTACFSPPPLHFRYDYKTDAPWLEPAIRLIGEGARRRARILGLGAPARLSLFRRLAGGAGERAVEDRGRPSGARSRARRPRARQRSRRGAAQMARRRDGLAHRRGRRAGWVGGPSCSLCLLCALVVEGFTTKAQRRHKEHKAVHAVGGRARLKHSRNPLVYQQRRP